MEKVILNAEVREEKGKIKVKLLRRSDIIPAVVYKDGKEAMSIKVKKRDFYDTLHTAAGDNVLITLHVKDAKKIKEKTCIIKELQKDPVKEDITHIDLNEISLTEKIKVKVAVHPHGEAEGVKTEDGVLDHQLWEIEVECLPTEIPEKISVEVGPMKIGDTVFVKDLAIPDGVTVLTDPELTVLSVVPPAKEEVVEEVVAEEGAEPEIISKGKKEEEEIPEGDTGEAKPKKEEAPPKKEEEKKG